LTVKIRDFLEKTPFQNPGDTPGCPESSGNIRRSFHYTNNAQNIIWKICPSLKGLMRSVFCFAGEAYAEHYGIGDRIWWAGTLQFAAGFSEIETLVDQVSGDIRNLACRNRNNLIKHLNLSNYDR
jgi:hypothetical protein